MSNRSLALLVASMLIFVTVVPIAIAYDDKPSPIEAEIIGEDAYGNYVLSATADELIAEGYRYGDYVEMDFGLFDGYGIFLPDISTCHPYELALVGDGTGNVSAVAFNSDLALYLPVGIGDHVRLSYDSHTTRLQDYPCMANGYNQHPMQWQTDEDFANFRCIDLNGFKLYRCTSPIYDHGADRMSTADRMYQKYGITYDVHMGLGDSVIDKVIDHYRDKHIVDNYISLYDSGRVHCSFCNADTVTHADQIRNVILHILDHPDERICVHCNQGKDRTGFVFMLLESIAGWSEEEIMNDYVQSFLNMYGIENGSREHQLLCADYFKHVAFIMSHPFAVNVSFVVDWDQAILEKIDYYESAKRFLLENVGLTQEEFDRLYELVN